MGDTKVETPNKTENKQTEEDKNELVNENIALFIHIIKATFAFFSPKKISSSRRS